MWSVRVAAPGAQFIKDWLAGIVKTSKVRQRREKLETRRKARLLRRPKKIRRHFKSGSTLRALALVGVSRQKITAHNQRRVKVMHNCYPSASG